MPQHEQFYFHRGIIPSLERVSCLAQLISHLAAADDATGHTQSFSATQDKNLPAAAKPRAAFIRAGVSLKPSLQRRFICREERRGAIQQAGFSLRQRQIIHRTAKLGLSRGGHASSIPTVNCTQGNEVQPVETVMKTIFRFSLSLSSIRLPMARGGTISFSCLAKHLLLFPMGKAHQAWIETAGSWQGSSWDFSTHLSKTTCLVPALFRKKSLSTQLKLFKSSVVWFFF